MPIVKVAIGVLACILAGCASAPTGIARGEPVAFVHEPLPYNERLEVKARDIAISQDLVGGATAGSVGGLLLGFTCGPYFPLCMGAGALVGMVGGAAIGAGIGVVESMPADSRRQLERRVSALPSGELVRERVMEAIVARGKGHWTEVRHSDAVKTVKVRVDQVTIYGARTGRVGLAMRVVLTLRPAGGSRHDEIEREILYRSPESEVRLWLEDAQFVESAFEEAYRSIAQSAFATLAR